MAAVDISEDEITRAAAAIWGRKGAAARKASQTAAALSEQGKAAVRAREEQRAMRAAGRGDEIEGKRRTRRQATRARAQRARRARRRGEQ